MGEKEIIAKLNDENNFHLTLKVIQFSEDKLALEFLNYIKQYNSFIYIDNLDEAYDLLKKAYIEKIDYVVCNNQISFLLPLVSVISSDDLSIIKSFVPVFYYLKDNILIQKLKTYCHKSDYKFYSFKTTNNLFVAIKELISF